MPTFIVTNPIAGANLNVSTATQQFSLGANCKGTQDTDWVYVQANGAISVGDIVEISATGTATRATTAGPRTSVTELGAAQNAFADTEFGWIARKGYGLTVAVSATVQPGVLYIATTSGKLSNTSASSTIAGILLNNASATATTTTTTGTLTWPRSIVANG